MQRQERQAVIEYVKIKTPQQFGICQVGYERSDYISDYMNTQCFSDVAKYCQHSQHSGALFKWPEYI